MTGRGPENLGRRALVRGAAWSVPAVAVAATAPAYGASLCAKTPAQPVTWSAGTASNAVQTGVTPDGIEVNVTAAHTAGAGGGSLSGSNLSAVTVATTRDAIALVNNSPSGILANPAASFQTAAFNFSRPVYGLNFFIDDIDRDLLTYQDRIAVEATPVATPVVSRGARISGAGTLVSPWNSSIHVGDNDPSQTVQVTYPDDVVATTSLSLRLWSSVLPLGSVLNDIVLRQMSFRVCA